MSLSPRVLRLQALVEDSARFGMDFLTAHHAAAEGSPAMAEVRSEPWGTSCAMALDLGVQQLAACHDFLGSMGHLIPPPKFGAYGIQVMARAALEAAGRAWWLLDTEVSIRTRAERGLTEYLDSLNEYRKTLVASPEPKFPKAEDENRRNLERIVAKAKSIRELAAERGLEAIPKDPGKPLAGVGGVRPKSTALAADVLGAAGVDVGGSVFRLLSGPAHVTVAALRIQLLGISTDEGETTRGAALMTVDQLKVCVGASLAAWMVAFDHALRQMGWPRSEWEARRLRTVAALAEIDQENPNPLE